MIPKPGGKDSVIGSAFQEAFPFYARLRKSFIIGRIGARTELTFSVAIVCVETTLRGVRVSSRDGLEV
jgi:hypothetical protein